MSSVELKTGNQHLEGVFFPQFAGYTESAKQQFINEYGKEPIHPDSAVSAHDALFVLIQAISQAGIDSNLIKEYIYNHKFKGIIGEFDFRKNGDANVPVELKTIKQSKVVNLKEI